MVVRYGFNHTLIRDLAQLSDRFGTVLFASLALGLFLLILVLAGRRVALFLRLIEEQGVAESVEQDKEHLGFRVYKCKATL